MNYALPNSSGAPKNPFLDVPPNTTNIGLIARGLVVMSFVLDVVSGGIIQY